MKNYAFINDRQVLREEATLGINDLALLRGYGIFDFFKTINGAPVWLEDHLDRFYFSASEMNLKVPYQRDQLRSIIDELMRKNQLPDSGIRITLTGGYSEDGYTPGNPNLVITQTPFTYDPAGFLKGTTLVTFEHQRQVSHVKTIDYLQAIRLQPFMRQQGAQDVLYFWQDEVLECPRANFFLVNAKQEIITPSRNILEGITRRRLLAMEEVRAVASILLREELLDAKEAFITSTTRLVCPVLSIDGQVIGNGRPGEVTRGVWERMMKLQGVMGIRN